MENSCKEEFYNFKNLCDAMLMRDLKQVHAILTEQSRCLFNGPGPSFPGMLVFLTSMNRSFYNYILYTTGRSLHQCCYENGLLIHHCRTKETFFRSADTIIQNYCRQLEGWSPLNMYILRAKEYIDRNLDKNLRLEEVAAKVYISKAYLSELFTAYTGKSFSSYITERRMERARQLLATTRLSIHDVGMACGFLSPAYFSTVFTKQSGLSPRQYRAAMARSARHSA